MTDDRIKQHLALHKAQHGRHLKPTVLEASAFEILQWMVAPGGPVELADEAAIAFVRDNCVGERRDGGAKWWDITHVDPSLELGEDSSDDSSDECRHLRTALRYLTARGLLQVHPGKSYLVRTAHLPS